MEEQRSLEIEIPFSNHLGPSDKTYLIRMPNFLSVEPKCFNDEEFLEQIADEMMEEDLAKFKLRMSHTIRWRMHNGAPQSNARIIEWNDGSKSLVLGDEMFDVRENELTNDNSFLASSLPAQGLLAIQSKFTHNLTFIPTSTSSMTHKRLTEAISKRQVKSRSVKAVETVQDPEKMKKEAEKMEEMRLKSRRKLDMQRKATRNRFENAQELSADVLEAEDDVVEESYAADDFVVDDEMEEEENANRLMQVKERGSELYENRQVHDEEEEEEAEFTESEASDHAEEKEVVEGDGTEESAARLKKRRVISESDEE